MITLPPRLKAAARFILRQRVRQVSRIRESIEGKSGIEIGGPSYAFTTGGIVPIYRYISHLDHINFSGDTVWGKHSEIIIREGTDLHGLPDCAFDFVLSSHNLEHIANPVKALLEWKRVMKSGGSLILILPNYRFTFDHRRAPTTVAHMRDDYEKGVDETDLTHLPEILQLHDLSLDPQSGTAEQFRERSLKNFENRCLHHHVFNEHNSRELLEHAGFRVLLLDLVRPNNIVLLARND
jgi:SAM-dependent methyltransferase